MLLVALLVTFSEVWYLSLAELHVCKLNGSAMMLPMTHKWQECHNCFPTLSFERAWHLISGLTKKRRHMGLIDTLDLDPFVYCLMTLEDAKVCFEKWHIALSRNGAWIFRESAFKVWRTLDRHMLFTFSPHKQIQRHSGFFKSLCELQVFHRSHVCALQQYLYSRQ